MALASGAASVPFSAVADAHATLYPDATPAQLLLKLGEEVGELMRAENSGRGSVPEEAADVAIVLAAYLGRYYPDVDLAAEVRGKLDAKLWRRARDAGWLDPDVDGPARRKGGR